METTLKTYKPITATSKQNAFATVNAKNKEESTQASPAVATIKASATLPTFNADMGASVKNSPTLDPSAFPTLSKTETKPKTAETAPIENTVNIAKPAAKSLPGPTVIETTEKPQSPTMLKVLNEDKEPEIGLPPSKRYTDTLPALEGKAASSGKVDTNRTSGASEAGYYLDNGQAMAYAKSEGNLNTSAGNIGGRAGVEAKTNFNSTDGIGTTVRANAGVSAGPVDLEAKGRIGANFGPDRSEAMAKASVGVNGVELGIGGGVAVNYGRDGRYGAEVDARVGPVRVPVTANVTATENERTLSGTVGVGLGRGLSATAGASVGWTRENGYGAEAGVSFGRHRVGVGISTERGLSATIPGVGEVSTGAAVQSLGNAARAVGDTVSSAASSVREGVSSAATAVSNRVSNAASSVRNAWRRLWR